MQKFYHDRLLLLIVVLAMFLSITSAGRVSAAVYTVTRFDDPTPNGCAVDGCSLREAMLEAEALGGVHTINLSPGTYTISLPDGSFGLPGLFESSLTINANGASIVVDPALVDPDFQMFFVLEPQSLTVNDINVSQSSVTIFRNVGTLTINNGNFTDNTGTVIRSNGDLLYVNNSIFANNSIGDAISITASDSIITDSVFINNSSEGNGGAIQLSVGSLTIINSIFEGNDGRSAGAIYVRTDGTLNILNSVLNNNSSPETGTIAALLGNISIVNSTISGNTGTTAAAIYARGELNISNSTIWNNTGAHSLELRGTIQIKNSIIGGTVSGVDCLPVGVTFVALSSNIDSDGTCASAFVTGFTTIDPMLGALQDNGGSTSTHALLTGSAAIDAVTDCTTIEGDTLTTDQRGIARPQDGNGDTTSLCDIGAYELEDDGDGISADTEDGAPNGGDGNNDGILDSEQPEVTSFPNSADNSYITLVSPAGTSFADVEAIGNPSPSDTPSALDFPIGFMSFAVVDLPVGGSTTVTVIADGAPAFTTYYKYGPTPDNTLPHWYEFLYDGTTGAEINGSQITLHFVDGQRGDDDLTANGQIVEPGAPAVLSYAFTGFFNPVDGEGSINQVNAGRAIPIKFSLDGYQGLDIFADFSPSSIYVSQDCTSAQDINTVADETTVTAGNSTLAYDQITDTYTYVWATERSWAGTCRQLNIILKDGTNHVAWFEFR